MLPGQDNPSAVFATLLVGGLITRVRGWWRPPPAALAVPYEVACACGEMATGLRKPEPQTVRCGRCGEALFILPLSCLPRVEATPEPGKTSRGRWTPTRLGPWAVPALAASLTLLALVALYWLLFAPAVREQARDGRPPPPTQETVDEVAARIESARRHLGLTNFRLALEDLEAARALNEPLRDPGSASRRRELARLVRQAELLGDLLTESLEEVLRHAAGVQEREWLAEFRHRYRGKAVVLDVQVQVGDGGRLDHNWQLRAPDERAVLDLNDLELLHRIPLNGPHRMLLGARLASVRREPGRWVIRLEPDSGVLITEPEAAVACFLSPEDPEVHELLRRQSAWAARELRDPLPPRP